MWDVVIGIWDVVIGIWDAVIGIRDLVHSPSPYSLVPIS